MGRRYAASRRSSKGGGNSLTARLNFRFGIIRPRIEQFRMGRWRVGRALARNEARVLSLMLRTLVKSGTRLNIESPADEAFKSATASTDTEVTDAEGEQETSENAITEGNTRTRTLALH
jgi:hypothetical protein